MKHYTKAPTNWNAFAASESNRKLTRFIFKKNGTHKSIEIACIPTSYHIKKNDSTQTLCKCQNVCATNDFSSLCLYVSISISTAFTSLDESSKWICKFMRPYVHKWFTF